VLRPDLAYPSAGLLPVALGFGVVDRVVLAVAGIGLNWTRPDLGGDSGRATGLVAERLLPDGSIGCVVYMP